MIQMTLLLILMIVVLSVLLLARFVHDSIPEEEMYHTAARTLFNASMASDVNSIFTKIKKELIPWALGEGDPIKERVVARKAEEEA